MIPRSTATADRPGTLYTAGEAAGAEYHVPITRGVRLPDPIKIARFQKSPELGPRILFFSGGSALRSLSQRLIHATHNSIHIITPFDSGGSSAKLREAFRMPAIGDIRNRLMALADQTLHGNPEVFALFSHRFPRRADRAGLVTELDRMIAGEHPLVGLIPDPIARIIRTQLRIFRAAMPADFDLRGASIGNLILAAGYLENECHLNPVIYLFSRLVSVRGVVRPVVDDRLHLVAELEDGTALMGQHLLAGTESPPIASRVRTIYLTDEEFSGRRITPAVTPEVERLIAQAELICYPMGSFYSSLMVNLLPAGVGRAVAANPCPKIYIPSTGIDRESFQLGVAEQVHVLVEQLRRDAPEGTSARDLVGHVLLDVRDGSYPGGLGLSTIQALGVDVLRYPLVTEGGAGRIYEGRLLPLLLSLC